mmetsp:Transcript_32262/g.52272  ORF Transcript_32262/g.52272 Transcript_32262/m.52272 type:complete len:106 (-) Transcript_32262:623-940(-)
MSFRSLKTNSSEIAHLPGTPQAKSVGNYTDDKSEISCGNNSIHRQVSETPESVCKPRKDKEEKNVLSYRYNNQRGGPAQNNDCSEKENRVISVRNQYARSEASVS